VQFLFTLVSAIERRIAVLYNPNFNPKLVKLANIAPLVLLSSQITAASLLAQCHKIKHATNVLTTPTARAPIPGLATVLVPSIINPSPVVDAPPAAALVAVVRVLAGTNPSPVLPVALTNELVPLPVAATTLPY
jgi:hypothetical protein